ncbi:MAG TPA: D-alanyl-D-alanine carboxypeptidase family protein [Geminicoccaceae bacterium]|nr:D-alanyl-D-alanine carboxypeptidase family protein [Geminicoccaceae bacterium]
MLNKFWFYGRLVLGLLVLLASSLPPSVAKAYDTLAKAAILIDHDTGQVLFAKNPDEPVPPASMSKLMTVLMVFERLHDGRLHLDDEFTVSEKAWRKGGSKMFVEVGKRVRVGDLLRGIIVQSGNDACIVVAENLAGSEEAFAAEMTARAHELGMTQTTLKNASGWPDPGHLMSVRDLATLAGTIISNYPEYYEIFSEKEFEFNGILQYARNPLLRRDVGADGLKTGHTEEAGYGLTASAVRDGRRLVLVLAGLETPGQRAREAERLLEHGFRDFKAYQLFAAGQTVDSAPVWLGDQDTVPLVTDQSVVLTLTPEARRQLEVKVIYDSPVPAPVALGAPLAQLEITAPGIEPKRMPLIAGEEIQAAGLLGRMSGALGYLIWGRS